MPPLSWPRIFVFLMRKSPGSTAPGSAQAVSSPARALGAPQTICTGSAWPTSTMHTCRRSASGCLAALTMRATTTPENAAATGSRDSTSMPPMVSRCSSAAPSTGGLQ